MKGAVQDRETFRGIALTLLALARLAERAALRAFPVRLVVLAILYRAEAIARAYVAREIEAEWPDPFRPDPFCPDLPCLDEPPARHFGAADAAMLALRLRMLAALLGALADADAAPDDRPAAHPPGLATRPGGAPDLPLLLLVLLPTARCRFPLRPP